MRLARTLVVCFGLLGAISLWLSDSLPRVIVDARHADAFVPATGFRITRLECETWNFNILNDCRIAYAAPDPAMAGILHDLRFGAAPPGPVRLLRSTRDGGAITTDVSLATLANRATFAVAMIAGGIAASSCLIVWTVRAKRPEPVIEDIDV